MRKPLLFVLLILFVNLASAQVDCDNIGFEKGNLLGWQAWQGVVTDDGQNTIYSGEGSVTNADYFRVTSLSDGNDPRVPSIPMVAPGSTHSIRLGNTSNGGDYYRIRTNYKVSADYTLFQYKFAVVLQNSGDSFNGNAVHQPFQKPGFSLEIYDATGGALKCSNYEIQLQGRDVVDGFEGAGDVQFRNWTTGAIDLRDYVGKTITIVVTAHGCTRQRHFGYAYFDAQCVKTEIKAMSKCPDDAGMMTLIAPEGFGKYSWNNGETSQTMKVAADLGTVYHVKMEPNGSLDESCVLQLDYTLKYQAAFDTLNLSICEGEEVAVGDTVYRTTGTFVRRVTQSTVCDSTVTLHLKVNPVHHITRPQFICEGESVVIGDTTFGTTGTHVRVLRASTGCDSTITLQLQVNQMELSVTPSLTIIRGDSVKIAGVVVPAGTYDYRWDPPTAVGCESCGETWVKPSLSTNYTLYASDMDEACLKKDMVKVTVKPCEVYVPQAFSPNQDGKNEVLLVFASHCIKAIQKMTIYNRWGMVVYQRENFSGSDQSGGWDGTYKGAPGDPGIYPYKIRAELASGKVSDFQGTISLVR
jgi:gliding motility-associated-like protein